MGASGNQYVRNMNTGGFGPVPQMAGQGSFAMLDGSAISAATMMQGYRKPNPNLFYGSQFINQVQQCPGAGCQSPQIESPPPQPLPSDQQQPIDSGAPDAGQRPPQDQQSTDFSQQQGSHGNFAAYPGEMNMQMLNMMMQQQLMASNPFMYMGYPTMNLMNMGPLYGQCGQSQPSVPWMANFPGSCSCGRSSINQNVYG